MNAKPFDWQVPAIAATVEGLCRYPYYLRADGTGLGKTYIALFACKDLGIKPFVIAPKITHSAWRQAAEEIGVELLDVTNIEKLKAKNHNTLLKLPPSGTKKYPIANWKWNLPEGTLVIFDEIQVAGGQDTQNSRALYAMKGARLPCLMMSATVAEDPMRLKSIGYLLGLHNYSDYRNWCIRHGCVRNPFAAGYGLMFSKSSFVTEKAMAKIHKGIFPEKGGRLRAEDIKEFPENAIFAEAFNLPNEKEVQAIYDELEEALIDAEDDEPGIVKRLRARQQVEAFKSVIFTQLTLDALEEGKSIVIFVSFKATMDAIEHQLSQKRVASSRIEGGQSQEIRDKIVEDFQMNRVHVAICMIQAGGVGVSLHDLHGRPRESLISPPDSATHLKQALGRVHRAGSLSKAIQKVIFVAGTVEEDTCKTVRRKLTNLDRLNDGDLATGAGF